MLIEAKYGNTDGSEFYINADHIVGLNYNHIDNKYYAIIDASGHSVVDIEFEEYERAKAYLKGNGKLL